MAGPSMIRGTLILTVAIFVSKFLGLLFIIPFSAIVGNKGVSLYGIAYTPYSIILGISTMGVPLAVSKFVSKYNTLGDYNTGRRLFRSGLGLMTLTGLLGFLIMFIFAPLLAKVTFHGVKLHSNTFNDGVLVIRVVSMALIIVPAMSLIRGYFQGFQSMGPTAISQVVEQVVRIAFILISAYLVMDVFHGTPTTAAAMATFAAFVGAVAGFYILGRYWAKRKPYLDEMVENSTFDAKVSLPKIYRELIAYAVPFVAVGIGIQLYELVDQFTLYYFLGTYHHYSLGVLEEIFSDLITKDQKLVMIPVSLSTALALSVVPSVTASFAEKNHKEMHHKITQALQFVLFLTIPTASGLAILGYLIHGMLYGVNSYGLIGGQILRWYAPTGILFALFTVTASILQGINRQNVTIISLLIGLIIKIILNPILLIWMNAIGAIIATDLGFIVSVIINLWAIQKRTHYAFGFISRRFLLISIFTIVMLGSIKITLIFIGGTVPGGWWYAVYASIISIIIGSVIFALLSLKSGLLKQILGRKIPFLNRFM